MYIEKMCMQNRLAQREKRGKLGLNNWNSESIKNIHVHINIIHVSK
jgi:hypothetical protein